MQTIFSTDSIIIGTGIPWDLQLRSIPRYSVKSSPCPTEHLTSINVPEEGSHWKLRYYVRHERDRVVLDLMNCRLGSESFGK